MGCAVQAAQSPAGRGDIRIDGKGVHPESLTSTVDGAPRFAPGEEVFLFLAQTPAGEWTVAGWTLGTFRVVREKHSGRETVTQDAAGVTLFDPATRQFQPGGVRQMELREFRRRLDEAIARGAGRRP